MKKIMTLTGLILGLLANTALADHSRKYTNKLITAISIDDKDITVKIGTGGAPVDFNLPSIGMVHGKLGDEQLALGDGPNKAAMLQLIINAFTAKTPLTIETDDLKALNGSWEIATITKVSGGYSGAH